MSQVSKDKPSFNYATKIMLSRRISSYKNLTFVKLLPHKKSYYSYSLFNRLAKHKIPT